MTALTDAELDALAQALLLWPAGEEMPPNLAHTARALAELRTLRGEAERMRAVVEAAEAVRDQGSAWAGDDLDVAVDAYRAAKETGR